MENNADTLSILYVVGAIFVFILVVLWFLLPFAVFGTKTKLDEIASEQKKTNKLLAAIHKQLRKEADSDLPRFSTKDRERGN